MMRALEGRAEALAGTFNAQEVANTLWAYATMGREPGAGVMRGLEGRAEALAGTFNAQGVANTLWAYATMGWDPRFPGNLFLVFQQGLVDGHVSVGAVDIPILLRAVSGLGVLLQQSTLKQFIKTLEADNVTNPFDVYCAAVWCYNAVCEERSYSDWAALLQTCLERTNSLSQWGSVSGPGFLRFLDALFFTPTVVAKQLRQHDHGQMCKAVRERVDLCLSQCTTNRGDIIQLKGTTDVVFRIRQGDLVVAASLLGWVHASTHNTIKLSLSDPQNALVGHIISFRDAVVSSRGQDKSFDLFCLRVCHNEWYDTLIRHDAMVTKRLYFHALEGLEAAVVVEEATSS